MTCCCRFVINRQQRNGGDCKSFEIQSDVITGTVLGQTRNNDPTLNEFTIITDSRAHQTTVPLSCTQAGLISFTVMSETDLRACVNTQSVTLTQSRENPRRIDADLTNAQSTESFPGPARIGSGWEQPAVDRNNPGNFRK